MGLYQQVRELWKQPKANLGELWRQRLIRWRREPATIRIEHPTRIDRARSLGYKAKQGILVVRQRLLRGGHQRPTIRSGRRPKHFRRHMVLDKSYQRIAEERANQKYPNCEVLNSYQVAKDGKYYWYEIILLDRNHPGILSDPRFSWINEPQHRGRAFRGLTSSGRKGRGIRGRKGKGAEKVRPSKAAAYQRKVNHQFK